MRIITKHCLPRDFTSFEQAIITNGIKNADKNTVWYTKQPFMCWFANNAEKQYFNFDYAKELGLHVGRSFIFSGKPTSIVILGNTIGLMFVIDKKVIKSREELVKFMMEYWIAAAKYYNLSLEIKNNDLVVSGTDKKILGSVAFETEDKIGCNCMFTLKNYIDVDFNKLFLMPKEKFEDKSVKDPKSRITNFFDEAGIDFDFEASINTLTDHIANVFGEVECDNFFSNDEMLLYYKFSGFHNTKNWVEDRRNTIKYIDGVIDVSSCSSH